MTVRSRGETKIRRRGVVRRRFALAVAAFVLLACRRARAGEPDLTSAGTRDLTITVGEEERTYRLHVPAEKPPAQK